MTDEENEKQRIEGANAIIEKAKEKAVALGIGLTSIHWDGGQKIVEKKIHTLVIECGTKITVGVFSDSHLTDCSNGCIRMVDARLDNILEKIK